jgi:hypothetical protein
MKAPEGDVPPPWVVYPGNDPFWGGWRQGESEGWLQQSWMPFWLALDRGARDEYLLRWPPPDDWWRETLTVHWV